jgi:phosphoribosylglycinamide formyltransferase-1
VPPLHNLVVELDDAFVARARGLVDASDAGHTAIESTHGIAGDAAAWIDETFGGSWSSEAAAGDNLLARRDGRPEGFATIEARGLRFRWLRGRALDPDTGLFGPFGLGQSARGQTLGRELLMRALLGLRERGYTRALIAAVGDDSLVRYYAGVAGARVVETFTREEIAPPQRLVVMASGGGTNLQAVIDACSSGRVTSDIAGVVVNRATALAIERAQRAALPTVVAAWDRANESRDAYDRRLRESVSVLAPDVVVLLGWMHLLDERFVREFPRIINLHPAFLPLDFLADDVELPDATCIPAFRGAHAIRDAVAAASPWAGATVHDVTPDTDRGPVVVRAPVRLDPGGDEVAALAKIRPIEHRLVVAALLRCQYES